MTIFFFNLTVQEEKDTPQAESEEAKGDNTGNSPVQE